MGTDGLGFLDAFSCFGIILAKIQAFSSCMVPVKVGRAYTGECINIMVQALWMEDGSLLQGLTIQNMYMELRQGSKKAVMVVRNSTIYPLTL